MPHICVVTQDLRVGGGVLTKLIAFLRFADSRGYTCDVHYPAERPTPVATIDRLRQLAAVARLYPVRVPEQVPHFARVSAFARRCRFATPYDAYQLISGGLAHGLPFVRAARPFVAWVAGPARQEIEALRRTKLRHYYLYNPVTLSALRRREITCGRHASLVLADSRFSADSLATELYVPWEKLRVLTTPVDLERFRPGRPVAGPRRYVLSVSRLARGKGFPTLLRAFQEVARQIDDVELRIAGDGAERALLERLTASYGLQERVTFLGELNERQLADMYAGAALFVLPSHLETLSIVVLEAMACGLPVVSTACGGPADHVHEGETGFLVPVGDWRRMSERIVALLREPELAARMGRAAHLRASSTFSTALIYRELDALYADTFGMGGDSSARERLSVGSASDVDC